MSARQPRPTSSRGRWAVASRVLAAAAGGYAVTSLLAMLLAVVLPRVSAVSRADGVLIATLLSFAVYTGVVVWVFSVRSATRAWVGLVLMAVACAVALWILPLLGGAA